MFFVFCVLCWFCFNLIIIMRLMAMNGILKQNSENNIRFKFSFHIVVCWLVFYGWICGFFCFFYYCVVCVFSILCKYLWWRRLTTTTLYTKFWFFKLKKKQIKQKIVYICMYISMYLSVFFSLVVIAKKRWKKNQNKNHFVWLCLLFL